MQAGAWIWRRVVAAVQTLSSPQSRVTVRESCLAWKNEEETGAEKAVSVRWRKRKAAEEPEGELDFLSLEDFGTGWALEVARVEVEAAGFETWAEGVVDGRREDDVWIENWGASRRAEGGKLEGICGNGGWLGCLCDWGFGICGMGVVGGGLMWGIGNGAGGRGCSLGGWLPLCEEDWDWDGGVWGRCCWDREVAWVWPKRAEGGTWDWPIGKDWAGKAWGWGMCNGPPCRGWPMGSMGHVVEAAGTEGWFEREEVAEAGLAVGNEVRAASVLLTGWEPSDLLEISAEEAWR